MNKNTFVLHEIKRWYFIYAYACVEITENYKSYPISIKNKLFDIAMNKSEQIGVAIKIYHDAACKDDFEIWDDKAGEQAMFDFINQYDLKEIA
jgi:hypothetical protein